MGSVRGGGGARGGWWVTPTVVVINGPNLNLLGSREPAVYGTTTLLEIETMVRDHAAQVGWQVEAFQSNHEGDLIDRVQAAAERGAVGIILNGGALTHYSYALADALRAVDVPAVEVHISDIHNREPWRRQSVTGEACIAVISGHGPQGYVEALDMLVGRATEAGDRTQGAET